MDYVGLFFFEPRLGLAMEVVHGCGDAFSCRPDVSASKVEYAQYTRAQLEVLFGAVSPWDSPPAYRQAAKAA